jgi:hypothetical protein
MGADAFSRLNGWRGFALVFSVSLTLHLLLDMLFQMSFGWHAVNHAETWFYTAVMEGTKLPPSGVADPTVWLLRGVGLLFPRSPLLGVLFSSAVLSSLTAVATYLLVRELQDQRTGLVAGLTYGGMVGSLGLSMSGFTHDHLQLPLMLAALIAAIRARKSKGARAAYWLAVFAVLLVLGQRINLVIWTAIGVAAVYWAHLLVRHYARTLFGFGDSTVYLSFIVALSAGLFFFGMPRFESILEGSLESLPQGRMGSADVVPVSLLNLWLRYNILLFVLPYGVVAAYRRRDVVGPAFLAIGLAVASVMDRGTRISDIGAAMLFAYAATEWTGGKSPSGRRWAWTAAYSAAAFACMAFSTPARPLYLALFLFGGVGLLLSLRGRGDRALLGAAASVILVGAFVNVAYVHYVDGRNIPADAEYELMAHLAAVNSGGKVLVAWDHGYMAEAVTGLESVSTPNWIDQRIHDMLWMPSRQAALSLRAAGVRYVLLSSGTIALAREGAGRVGYSVSGGLVFRPRRLPDTEYAYRYALFGLANGSAGEGFRLLRAARDPGTGLYYMLYEVSAEPSASEAAGTLVGGVAVNGGDSTTAAVNASFVSAGAAYSATSPELFAAGEVRDVLYAVPPRLVASDCALSSDAAGVGFPAVFC